ncbi:divergent polysaccharide deacetylase family protein [Pseudorhodobacter sp. W20_MBD10_FR17]|uniref:divergent polysaccharide deacetylase family protein n=1 Tax=Pseudorhodobacter sp. W20_MBD10_FR17 TaxID=3240266 RepID=UPI003F9EA081
MVAGLGLVVASQVTEFDPAAGTKVAVDAAVSSAVSRAAPNATAVAPLAEEQLVSKVPNAPQDAMPVLTAPPTGVETMPELPNDNSEPNMVSAPASVAAETMGTDVLDGVATNAPEAMPAPKTDLAVSVAPEQGTAPDVPSVTELAPNAARMASATAPQPGPADAAPEPAMLPAEPAAADAAPDADAGDAAQVQDMTVANTEGTPVESLPAENSVSEPAVPEAAVPETTEPEVEIVVIDPPVARPEPGFAVVDGVKTGRLPTIAATPATQPEDSVVNDANLPPIERYAREFANPAQKPLFAILLRDTGGPDLDREALAAIPFPVSFVIDPTRPDAAVAAQIYRAAGQEVLMLGAGIPAGATASDLAVSLEAMNAILPEAVGVVDTETNGFQGNRTLATQVLALIADQGRGVISWDKGLNAASQVAQREGIRSAVIFRAMDGADEKSPVIRRYLDRAAFKAAQDGRVVVEGQTRPETVTALLEWAVEGRAATVAIAPATAVMTAQ